MILFAAYLFLFLSLRISFEILTALKILDFNLYNPLWYAWSLLNLIFFSITHRRLVGGSVGFMTIFTIFIVFLVSSISVVALAFFFYDEMPESSFGMYAGFILSHIAYISIGFCFSILVFRFIAYKTLMLFFAVLVLPILVIADYSTLSIPFREIFEKTGVNYLLFGDLISLSFFAMISTLSVKNNKMIFVVSSFILVSIILFINGSRTSFAVFVSCFVLSFGATQFPVRKFVYFFSASVFTLVFFITLFSIVELESGGFGNSRMLSILSTGSSDSSLVNRDTINDNAIVRIISNPIQGDIGGQVSHPFGSSPMGSYMHNIMSYWEQFGLLSFVSFIAMWVFLGVALFNKLMLESNRYIRLSLVAIFFYSIICMIFSRSFVHTAFAFAWSFILYYVYFFHRLGSNVEGSRHL